jgi:hypothetical protein
MHSYGSPNHPERKYEELVRPANLRNLACSRAEKRSRANTVDNISAETPVDRISAETLVDKSA